MGNYNDVLLQKLADEGDGQYAYIDDFPEADASSCATSPRCSRSWRGMPRRRSSSTRAKVERYRLLGYEKRDVADEKFRDDSVDGGEVGSGHAVTVLYEVKLRAGATGDLGAVQLRYADPVSRKVTEVRETIGGAQFRAAFASASPGSA